MTIEQWVTYVLVPAAAAIWGLVKIIGPRLSDAFIRRREATTEQMAKLIERQLEQNSLLMSFVTEKQSADLERLSEKIAEMDKRLVAIETLTRLMVHFVAQFGDDRDVTNRVLREMIIGSSGDADTIQSRDTSES